MTSYYSSSWGFPPWPVPDAQKKREKERREKRERRRDPRKEETYVGFCHREKDLCRICFF